MKPLLCYDKNNKVISESERKIIDSQIDEQNEKNKIRTNANNNSLLR